MPSCSSSQLQNSGVNGGNPFFIQNPPGCAQDKYPTNPGTCGVGVVSSGGRYSYVDTPQGCAKSLTFDPATGKLTIGATGGSGGNSSSQITSISQSSSSIFGIIVGIAILILIIVLIWYKIRSSKK